MDGAERIPIDIGYEVASAAEQPTAQRMTMRDDGTLVIDILAPPACRPELSTAQEIVVCAAAPDGGPAQGGATPLPKSLPDKLGEALNAVVGPLELGSIKKRDGTRAFGARVRF